jgi:hypothetical protein
MPAALEVKLPEGGSAPRVPLRPTGEPIEATNGFLSQASDAHSPKATANNGVWPLSMGGRGSNGSALAWMDPIEHRATFSWLKRSDALIVKTYAMSASKTRLAVLIGGGFMVVEESRIR